MTDPARSDSVETVVPTGDGEDLGASREDVPLTSDEAIARDEHPDARVVEP